MPGWGQGTWGNGPWGIGFTAGNTIYPVGWQDTTFGSPPYIYNVIAPQTINVPGIQGWEGPIFGVGQFGTTTVYNLLQFIRPVGFLTETYGVAFVAYYIQTRDIEGFDASVFGTASFVGYPQTRSLQGFVDSRFGDLRLEPLTLAPPGWLSETIPTTHFIAYRIRTVNVLGADSMDWRPSSAPKDWTRIYNVGPWNRPNLYPFSNISPASWDSLSVPVPDVYNRTRTILVDHVCPGNVGVPAVSNV